MITIKEVRDQVEYYFQYSSADCAELKSSWSSLVSIACYGPPSGYDEPYTDKVLSNIDRKRRIEKRLNRMPTRYVAILKSSFAPLSEKPIPAYILKHFNIYSGAAIHNELLSGVNDLVRYLEKIELKRKDTDTVLLEELKKNASIDYFRAVNMYIGDKNGKY